jgi:hypothetical protein
MSNFGHYKWQKIKNLQNQYKYQGLKLEDVLQLKLHTV